MTGEAALWFRRMRPADDAATRLFCFPHAGGSASFFHPLAGTLHDRVDVTAVQYPGRQDRRHEPAVTEIGELADRICAVFPDHDDVPFAFFGHSMGAVVCYELALRLAARGRPLPSVLFASGRKAPSCRDTDSVHLLDDAALVGEIAGLYGTDRRLLSDPDVLAMILPPLRADYAAIESYRWDSRTAPLDVPIVALVGDSDPRASVEEAAGWRRHGRREFELHVSPGGGHFYLSQEVEWTASRIMEGLGGRVVPRR